MVGTSVSHYRIVSHIGAGGMGTVYLAEDTALKRRVALKFVRQDTVGDQEATVRLLREARAASALDHPHIATVYEIGDHEGQPFIAMAYYEGETLAARLAGAPMALPEVARIVAQIADALHAAHAAGIVHRDVKPPNVMLTTGGQVKVLDFGLAKVETAEMATQLTVAGATVGTAAYMSPEQAVGELVDARSDLWSLGVVTYEMLTGARPFTGTNALRVVQAVLAASPAPVRTLRPDIAPELEAIVTRTLVRDREQRSITADQVRDLATACHARLSSPPSAVVAAPPASRRTRLAAAVVALAMAAGGIAWWVERNSNVRWARQDALPEIIRLAGADKFDEAYRLAQQVQAYIPDDLLLAEQLRDISRVATIDSDPVGAEVFYRPYGRSGDPTWRPLGRTPVKVRLPRGLHHWRAEMTGREAAEDVGPGGPYGRDGYRLRFVLFTADQVPEGMVRIASSGSAFRILTTGFEHLPSVEVPDYWIDRHEVTNRAFKRFVDDGGHRRAELWQRPILINGRTANFEAAMTHFRDATGRPGPAEWEIGTYLAGQADYPVGGVSWYEAAAYARWAGKSLPTVHQWVRAADTRSSAQVVPASNFGGTAPLPVGAAGGITRGGARDMAGNVKEWALNGAGQRRYILGGAWDDPVYMFTDLEAQSPAERHPTHGFRCVKVDRPDDLTAALTAPIDLPSRDVRAARPVSGPVFEAWRSLYAFDHVDLQVKAEEVNDESVDWRMEKVSYAAAYGDERIPAYLFLPKHAQPPYQVMVAFSGANVFSERSSATTTDVDRFNYIMRSGRAFLYPVYKSTFERGDSMKSDDPNMTVDFRDHVIMWSKDLGRSVDYLESRQDIAKDRIGYIGLSSGAALAPIFLAIERRLSLGVIDMGGLYRQRSLPEADAVNFAPRVKVPVLMLNGRFDYYFPTATSQEPLFELLGTPATHKRRVVYEASHNIPRTERMKEVVNWMDKYWGAPTPR